MTAVVIDHEDIPLDTSSNAAAAVTPYREVTDRVDPKSKPNRPDSSRWTQQNLRMWEPMLTLEWSIGICFLITASCVAIGVAIVIPSTEMNTYRVIYDGGSDSSPYARGKAIAQQADGTVRDLENCFLDSPDMANSFDAKHTCFVEITLREPITKPAYVYYELSGFYQHHRRFVSSMTRTQFTDEWRPGTLTGECAPLETIESEICTVGLCSTSSKKERTAFPCGIVSNTMFNDIFWLHEGILPSGERLGQKDLVSKGAARKYTTPYKNPSWSISLVDYLPVWNNPNFSRIIPPATGDQSPHITSDYTNSTAWVHEPTDPEFAGAGLENEHWRVWVETAAMAPFRKAYGRINHDLPAGTKLVFAVQSNFYVRSFAGTKSLIIGDLAWFGSDNVPLGAFFLGVGGIFFLFTLFFISRRCKNPRQRGDARALAWKFKKQ
ncbi:hypothetical protein Poli38472_011302 [Pythium oligandrum]|uniref:Uncharacterized protein n=1 Tax=Pythium oligandrum TaxID=41045 RepID=A0A8K1FQ84_PYTOL|nr:hypothetical protein Poli38472_011302 [Pythium oligandrum]|eukprot:TMW67682.1 hypothetical protein Poli38472_011302 [Pythium oligandrum]